MIEELEKLELVNTNQLRLLIIWRHEGIVPWEGGFVDPRDEARRVIKHLRIIRSRLKETNQ